MDDLKGLVRAEYKTDDDYSKIFETLVEGDDDEHSLVGYVAYAIYKIAKRDWVKNQYLKNNRRPTDDELRQYVSTWTDTRLLGLRTEANQTLAGFASYIVEQERPKILKEALQHKSFFREAFVACVGAFFYTCLLIIFAIVLKLVDIDVFTILEKVGVTRH